MPLTMVQGKRWHLPVRTVFEENASHRKLYLKSWFKCTNNGIYTHGYSGMPFGVFKNRSLPWLEDICDMSSVKVLAILTMQNYLNTK